MKKILSLLMALLMVGSMGLNALAGSGMNNFKTKNTFVGFADVVENAWYHGSVKAAFEYGLVKGTTPTTYNPTGSLTVAEAIVMADRIHTLYANGKDTLQNGNPWYQPYVDYAIAQGIITAGSFDSYTRKITRAEMADIFSRALPAKEYTVINKVAENCPADIIGHTFENEIRTLYRAGILTGNDVFGTFTPDQGIIRSEAAAIISRMVNPALRRQIELLEKQTYDNVTVAAPYGAAKIVPDPATADGGMELIGDRAGVMVYKTRNISDGKAGMTIYEVSQAELGAALAAGLGSSTVSEGVRTAFGKILAYRYEFEMKDVSGSFYVWMQGTDMMMAAATVLHDGTEADRAEARALLADLVNNITVSDNMSSIKLAK